MDASAFRVHARCTRVRDGVTRILVTGAAGSIGVPLVERLQRADDAVLATDIESCDVLSEEAVQTTVAFFRPDVIYHLAADKHAPQGERDPAYTALLNISGTENVLANANGAKVVLASTCKACDPETAYGASKLIAERMVLNASGVVVRYYNVRETAGNVFRLWESLGVSEPVPWTDCWRYFVSLDDAVALTVRAMSLPSGRYTLDPGDPVHMHGEADRLYPRRKLVEVPRRRGDRRRELLCASSEELSPYEGLVRVESPHDPEYVLEKAA